MKTLTYNCTAPTPYPVGKNINFAIAHAKLMANAFTEIFPTTFGKSIHIFCRGSSGAIFSSLFVSYLIRDLQEASTIHHIKKEGESSHDCQEFPPSTEAITIIIDDLICTGSTIEAIHERIDERHIDVLILACGSNYGTIELSQKIGFVPDYFIKPQ